MILIISLATIVSTFFGGMFAIRFRDKLHLILGFSAGAVIAVAFFDLLPESLEISGRSPTTVLTFVAIGFAIYLILDRFFSLHGHDDENCDNPSHSSKLGATALCFHSLLDGLAIGLSFKISPAVGWIVAVAVLTHDFSDGINTVGLVLKDKKSANPIIWLIADALAPAIGIIITLFFSVSGSVLGMILAIFCGFFLYIGASDLIPESHHAHPTIWTTVMTVLGMLVLFVAVNLAI
ncbi:MAG: ZIP family metal transporter [Candidatus Berkelbacteria bacterium]|nr:ZIP family metal transporter [Candidatus Berkelbacteria bacterium]